MTELPEHYPFANAARSEVEAWLAAEVPPYDQIFVAAPWYTRTEQIDWYLQSIRECLAQTEQIGAMGHLFGSSNSSH